jgi:predicted NUDIX family NTP pyrophosphohydrolase
LWARKDVGAWMVPKGLIEPGEEPLEAARREFEEETGLKCPLITRPLTPLRQAGGKTVLCWTAEGDLDLAAFRSGDFEMEWPPRSGRSARFPEIDRIAYFDSSEALTQILPSQAPLIAETLLFLGAAPK